MCGMMRRNPQPVPKFRKGQYWQVWPWAEEKPDVFIVARVTSSRAAVIVFSDQTKELAAGQFILVGPATEWTYEKIGV